MTITDVRINPTPGSGSLLAIACITLDAQFIIREVKIIDANGKILLGFPERKVVEKCPSCGRKNVLSAGFCNWCGAGLIPNLATAPTANVAHPMTPECREYMTRKVVAEYRKVQTSPGDQRG